MERAISNCKYKKTILQVVSSHAHSEVYISTETFLHENRFLCSPSEFESDPRNVEKHLINGGVLCDVPALQSRCTRIQVVYSQCEDIHCEGPFRISINLRHFALNTSQLY